MPPGFLMKTNAAARVAAVAPVTIGDVTKVPFSA